VSVWVNQMQSGKVAGNREIGVRFRGSGVKGCRLEVVGSEIANCCSVEMPAKSWGLGRQLPFKEQPTGHTHPHTCVCMCPALRQIIKISLSWQFTFYPVPNCVIRDSFFSCLL